MVQPTKDIVGIGGSGHGGNSYIVEAARCFWASLRE